MARQPIYDRQMGLFGYELLYRREPSPNALPVGPTALVTAIVDIGLGQLLEGCRGFVNISEDVLRDDVIQLIPRENVVLEILEDVPPTKENLDTIGRLAQMGYTIALDDYTFEERHDPFLDVVSLIKVDVLQTPPQFHRLAVQRLRARGATLLAEKVEDAGCYRAAMDLGFDLFQGYFFSKPAIVAGKGINPQRLALLKLLGMLQNQNVSFADLERVIMSDVSLSYRLLRFVSSAASGVRGRVESIRQAILFLGTQRVASIATLLAMSGASDKPSDLMTSAMVRAKTCETLAVQGGLQNPESYFTLGMLSMLDALLDMPMAEVVKQLPLAPEICEALLNPDVASEQAQVLRSVIAQEQAQWLLNGAKQEAQVFQLYVNSVQWARSIEQDLAA